MASQKLIDQPTPHHELDRFETETITFRRGPSITPGAAQARRRFNPTPGDAKPIDLFTVRQNACTSKGYRFIRKDDNTQMLMFVGGAVIGDPPKGGCAVVLTNGEEGVPVKQALENLAPAHTADRAALRAVLLALELRWWTGEGFKKIVIATDNEYVVEGMCQKQVAWSRNDWKEETGEDVENKDIWVKLMAKIHDMEGIHGEHVQFWLIPKELNEADSYAKDAARVSLFSGGLHFQLLIIHRLLPPAALIPRLRSCISIDSKRKTYTLGKGELRIPITHRIRGGHLRDNLLCCFIDCPMA